MEMWKVEFFKKGGELENMIEFRKRTNDHN